MTAPRPDVRVLQVKDYVARPKPNGPRSPHAQVEVPVHLSDRVVPVVVELRLRAVAMDFWAALEQATCGRRRSARPTSTRGWSRCTSGCTGAPG